MPPGSTYGYRTQAEIDAQREAEEKQQEEALRDRVTNEAVDYGIRWADSWMNNPEKWTQNLSQGTLDLGQTGDIRQGLDFTLGQGQQPSRFNLGQQATAAEQSFTLGSAAPSYDLGAGTLNLGATEGAGTTAAFTGAQQAFNFGDAGLGTLNTAGAFGGAGTAGTDFATTAGDYTLNVPASLDYSSAGQAAATQGTAQGTTGQTGSMTMGQAAGWMAAAASAAYIGNNLRTHRRDPWGNAMAGAQIGGQMGGWYGAAVGAVMGMFLGLGGDDKVTAQSRQMMRELEKTPLGQNLVVKTPNGPIALGQYYGKINPDTWEFKDPVSHLAISWTGPLAYMMTGDKQMGWRLNMLFANGLYVKGDPDKTRSNVLSLYKQMGVTPRQMQAALNEMRDKGIIDQAQFDSMQNVLGVLKPGGWNEQVKEQMMNIPFPGAQRQPAAVPAQPVAMKPAGPVPQGQQVQPKATNVPVAQARPKTLKQAAVMIQQRQQAQPQPPQRPAPRPQPQQRPQPQRRAA